MPSSPSDLLREHGLHVTAQRLAVLQAVSAFPHSSANEVLEKVQEQVEKLRDQLEGALHNWRESFTPEEAAKKPAPKAAPKHVGGGWYELPDGTRVQGKEAALKAMA